MPDAVGMQTSENSSGKIPLFVFFRDAGRVFKLDALGSEILRIAVPAALALAADPVASLVDTAFIGRLGPVELAAVGVSIAIFNQASKITIFPVVSITTSFVAEEDALNRKMTNEANSEMNEKIPEDALEKGSAVAKSPSKSDPDTIGKITNEANLQEDALEKGSADARSEPEASLSKRDPDPNKTVPPPATKGKKRHLPSASTALIFGTILGLLQAALLFFGGKILLNVMGVKPDSPMMSPALKYLTIRALGAPAVLLSLAMQGVFRGFKDTKTPLYAIVAGDLANIILDPIFIFVCHLGVRGAAIAHVLSQYLTSLILFLILMNKVHLMPPSFKQLQFGRFLKNGFLLLARVIAVTFCVTLASSMAARLGTTPMAAFQIGLQVWLTSSLLADALAVAGQSILATAFAEKDYKKVTATASRVLQMSLVLGAGLTVVVGVGLYFGSPIFSKDPAVLHLMTIAVPFVAATQPINTLAFVFDGINFGASDFAFTAYSMILVASGSIASIILLSRSNGFIGVWIALTIYMALRALAGVWRMGSGTGPWKYLRGQPRS